MSRKPIQLVALALLLLSCCFLATAAAGDKDKDKTPLEGIWKGNEGGKDASITFTGNKWVLKVNDGADDVAASGTFKIDPKQKPATMDLTIADANGKIEKYKGLVSKAIYELDGDKLKWCAGEPGKDERPTDFNTGLNITFMRAKK